jgi:ABC transporter DrrB family efflux protein
LELWAVVEERVAAGTSVMLTTQHLEEADRLAHRIAVVNHGRVVAEGTAEGLKRDSGGEVICVQVVDKSSLDMAAAVLSGVGPGQATINRATGEITIPTPDGMAALAQAARGFDEAQLAIASIELRRPSLDEVFLALTRQHPASAGPPVIVQDHRAVSQDRERTTTRTPPSAAITALRWTVSDTLALAGRTLRHWIRQPQLVLLSTVQPVMLVVLFTYVFGGAVATPGVRYVDFLLPGVMVQVVAWDSTQTAVGIAADRASSIMDRFRSLPICAPAILAGRTLADFCRNVLVVAAMIAVGHLVGFRFQGGAWAAASAAALVVGFGYAANWLFALIGLTSRGAEAAFAVSLIVVFPLMFASSAMVPPATMPGWLRPFAENQPISLTVNAARALTLGTPIGAELLGALAWIVGLLAIAVPAAVWRFNRVG